MFLENSLFEALSEALIWTKKSAQSFSRWNFNCPWSSRTVLSTKKWLFTFSQKNSGWNGDSFGGVCTKRCLCTNFPQELRITPWVLASVLYCPLFISRNHFGVSLCSVYVNLSISLSHTRRHNSTEKGTGHVTAGETLRPPRPSFQLPTLFFKVDSHVQSQTYTGREKFEDLCKEDMLLLRDKGRMFSVISLVWFWKYFCTCSCVWFSGVSMVEYTQRRYQEMHLFELEWNEKLRTSPTVYSKAYRVPGMLYADLKNIPCGKMVHAMFTIHSFRILPK